MKRILFLIILTSLFLNFQNQTINLAFVKENPSQTIRPKAEQALDYCKTNHLNTEFCLLLDMHIHSGKNRLFIWDFEKDTIMSQGLCSHGCCGNPWGEDYTADNPELSNAHGSHCSSLGKYKIGSCGWSNWGINVNYQLYGLEATNNNANARQIVLHGWEMLSDTEIYPSGSPEGWGCPAVSNDFMRVLDDKLKGVDTNVLLWIFQ